ncbi:MAG: hypothetical protein ACOX2L_00110 [Anaerolineae bacterium]|nr:hypothetical protein [Chloroflexota bacterium]
MEDRLQNVKNWARQSNLRQFQTELEKRLEPLGYQAVLELDRISCYRISTNKSVLGLFKKQVKQHVGTIRRQNGSIDVSDADEAFIQALSSVAPAS